MDLRIVVTCQQELLTADISSTVSGFSLRGFGL
jgi:hypothetical protein